MCLWVPINKSDVQDWHGYWSRARRYHYVRRKQGLAYWSYRRRVSGAASKPDSRHTVFWHDCSICPFTGLHLFTLAEIRRWHDLRKNVVRSKADGRYSPDHRRSCCWFICRSHNDFAQYNLGESIFEWQCQCASWRSSSRTRGACGEKVVILVCEKGPGSMRYGPFLQPSQIQAGQV